MKEKIRRFMYGRYGYDEFNRFLLILYLVIFFIDILFFRSISKVYTTIQFLSYVILYYSFFRTFSRNIYKRREENTKYLRYTYSLRTAFNRYKNMWHYRKEYKYFRCPYCHKYSRVPRGKGNITINCPHCHRQFDAKS